MNLHSRTVALVFSIFFVTCSWMVLADESKKRAGTETSSSQPDRAAQSVEDSKYVPKTTQELRKTLTPLQYDVTQNEETERAYRNLYWNNKKEGLYKCIVCERELFSSETKFKSGTGWPSFYAPIDEKNIGIRKDWRLIYVRNEVHCSRCNAHLGHVFDDGPKPTGKRYCMNSASMKFFEASKEESSEAKLESEEAK